MKRYEAKVPDYVIHQLKVNQENAAVTALYQTGKVIKLCTLPVRPAKMKVSKEDGCMLTTVIVPATDIYLSKNAIFDEGTFLDRNGMVYYIEGTKIAFPLAHVFNHSGSLCLGNIFVPSKVPAHSPQLPLETLFLHNDRKLSHGGASLILSNAKITQINELLAAHQIKLSENVCDQWIADSELLRNDTIWNLSEDVHKQRDLLTAIGIMKDVYAIIFKKELGVEQ